MGLLEISTLSKYPAVHPIHKHPIKVPVRLVNRLTSRVLVCPEGLTFVLLSLVAKVVPILLAPLQCDRRPP